MEISEKTMKEVFKDIPDFEGVYQVSNLGRVKSIERLNSRGRKVSERILRVNKDGGGYFQVSLYESGERRTKTVHILVAVVFKGHKPCGYKLVVNHINHNKEDNRVENLEIVTNRENTNQKHLKSSSKYVGVHWFKNAGKWRVGIRVNGKKKHLGLFRSEKFAGMMYNRELEKLLLP